LNWKTKEEEEEEEVVNPEQENKNPNSPNWRMFGETNHRKDRKARLWMNELELELKTKEREWKIWN
jgi:hypothetical protein